MIHTDFHYTELTPLGKVRQNEQLVLISYSTVQHFCEKNIMQKVLYSGTDQTQGHSPANKIQRYIFTLDSLSVLIIVTFLMQMTMQMNSQIWLQLAVQVHFLIKFIFVAVKSNSMAQVIIVQNRHSKSPFLYSVHTEVAWQPRHFIG